MDVNDIHARMNRLGTALDSRSDDDYKRHAKVEHLANGGVSVTLPGNTDQNEIENIVSTIVHLLGTVKDNLKKAIERKGGNKAIVEQTIDSSIYLQVLTDLVNADKHGNPLQRTRSGKNPVIKEVTQKLRNNNHGQPVIATISTAGVTDVVYGLPPSVVVLANVYDGTGNYLFDFDTLVENCYSQWMNLAKQNNCI